MNLNPLYLLFQLVVIATHALTLGLEYKTLQQHKEKSACDEFEKKKNREKSMHSCVFNVASADHDRFVQKRFAAHSVLKWMMKEKRMESHRQSWPEVD
jgi:hypothetical protein